MDNMKEEALRRAREMHRGVPTYPSVREVSEPNKNPPEINPQKIEEHREEITPREVSTPPALFEDKEKLMILMLLLILSSEENSDPVVLLALLYLII